MVYGGWSVNFASGLEKLRAKQVCEGFGRDMTFFSIYFIKRACFRMPHQLDCRNGEGCSTPVIIVPWDLKPWFLEERCSTLVIMVPWDLKPWFLEKKNWSMPFMNSMKQIPSPMHTTNTCRYSYDKRKRVFAYHSSCSLIVQIRLALFIFVTWCLQSF